MVNWKQAVSLLRTPWVEPVSPPTSPSLVGLQYFVKTRRWEKPASYYSALMGHDDFSSGQSASWANPFSQVSYGSQQQVPWVRPSAEAVVVDGEWVE